MADKNRPTIDLQPNTFDLICLGLVIISIIYIISYVLLGFDELPVRIPTHFNIEGQPDSFGSKFSIVWILLLEIGLSILLYIGSRFPHKHNYLIEITPHNARRVYGLSVSMMHAVNLCITLFFSYLVLMTIRIAHGQSNDLSNFAVLYLIGGLTLIVVIFLLKVSKSK